MPSHSIDLRMLFLLSRPSKRHFQPMKKTYVPRNATPSWCGVVYSMLTHLLMRAIPCLNLGMIAVSQSRIIVPTQPGLSSVLHLSPGTRNCQPAEGRARHGTHVAATWWACIFMQALRHWMKGSVVLPFWGGMWSRGGYCACMDMVGDGVQFDGSGLEFEVAFDCW